MAQRRAGRRRASGWLVATLGLLLATGCRWLPERRPSATLDPRPLPDLPGRSMAGPGGGVPLPSEPLQPLTDAEILVARPPTPALDAALALASNRENAVVAEIDHREDPPPLAPPRALPDFQPTPEESTAAEEAVAPRDDAIARASAPPPSEAPSDPAPPESVAPESAWRTGLDALAALARKQAGESPEEGGLWSARAEILGRLAESDSRDGAQVVWQTVLAALAEPQPDPEPTPQEPEPPALAIAELALCRRVDGFGMYQVVDPSAIRPGHEVVIYFEVEGLAATNEDGQFRTKLASTVSLLPEGSDAPAWTHPLGTAEDACRRQRRDYFVNGRIALPADLPPGPYRLRLSLDDLNSGRAVVREMPMTLAP